MREHMNHLIDLCTELTMKTAARDLGPADGKLYMQLCDTLTEYAKGLENAFRKHNTNESEEDDPESEGDKSSSPK